MRNTAIFKYSCVLRRRVSLQQRGDDTVPVRGRREAVNFWKRQHPDNAFWKRAHPYDTLDSFWKRGLPAGPGVQAFWKRFVETANDDDLAAAYSQIVGPYGTETHAANKKNVHGKLLQQQRRAKEMAGRRPEFNPTGW